MTSLELTSFLNPGNEAFIYQMYERWLDNPASVDSQWSAFFDEIKDDLKSARAEARGADWAPRSTAVVGVLGDDAGNSVSASTGQGEFTTLSDQALRGRHASIDSMQVLNLIRAYRFRGHLQANLDPLGLTEQVQHSELNPASYGFGPGDLDRPVFLNFTLGLEYGTVRQVLEALHQSYCGTIGVEYMHISEPKKRTWIQERIEQFGNHTRFSLNGKRAILENLIEADVFESFLDRKFRGTKRFGLDGGEAAISGVEQIVKRGSQLGVREFVIGMSHRGRLNMLANVMRKPYRAIFSEFQGGSSTPGDVLGSGDVKYHLGTSADRVFDNVSVHMSLTANPSHLEVVDPVVLGKVRAKQRKRGDHEREQVMGLLLHGDAAFAGQGVVSECFDMSELKGYSTGGTIHFVINNQIGFTTSPKYSRSSPYCSDIAKQVEAPIFHVNGDDAEAVVHVSRVAAEFRHRFKSDVVVDMICYRRHGHNESDEPSFTQPLMYKKIADHPTTVSIYAKQLEKEGVLVPGDYQNMVKRFENKLNEEFQAATSYKPNKADWLEGAWAGIERAVSDDPRRGETAVELDVLRKIGLALSRVPDTVAINPKVARQLDTRRKIVVETGEGIDWATAEALAFGSLLSEDVQVRLSGQDCGRGTFSQRHSVIVDQVTEDRYIPLNHIKVDQPQFEVLDSPLSEVGVLGFEYGYAIADPDMLVLWEAQFGDFANGAQVIFDQFVSSGEHKWLRMCGLVVLLPHGFEGQGPEHSSARLERYLQLCAEDNMQICNCTTPAQYFHVLRRQVRRTVRKPLILMTPKSLLRHKVCVSSLTDFGPGTNFHRLIWDIDRDLNPDEVDRIVICSGKVYYDLRAALNAFDQDVSDKIEIIRIEQLYPFPSSLLMESLRSSPKAKIIWCQEEPRNMGGWQFVAPLVEEAMEIAGNMAGRLVYAGRNASASPATGLHAKHVIEMERFIAQALTG